MLAAGGEGERRCVPAGHLDRDRLMTMRRDPLAARQPPARVQAAAAAASAGDAACIAPACYCTLRASQWRTAAVSADQRMCQRQLRLVSCWLSMVLAAHTSMVLHARG